MFAGLIVTAALAAYAAHRIWQVGQGDDRRPADAIVVLGAAQYNGTPSPVYEARLRHGVDLFKAGAGRLFVVTGGSQPGDTTTEAAAGREYALHAGVPDSAIVVEDESRTTLQSLEAVAARLRDLGSTSVVLVSDRTHMLRALRIAADLGLDARASPAPDSPTDGDPISHAGATLHELAALGLYFIGGRDPAEDTGSGR